MVTLAQVGFNSLSLSEYSGTTSPTDNDDQVVIVSICCLLASTAEPVGGCAIHAVRSVSTRCLLASTAELCNRGILSTVKFQFAVS